MIYDKIENLMDYAGTDASFADIDRFIKSNDMKTMKAGSYKVSDTVNVNISEYAPGDGGDYECHRLYCDLQYAITGNERIDVIPVSCGINPVGYKPDIDFYTGKTCNAVSVALDEGTFAYLAPGDAHKPCIKTDSETIRKAVFKIKINSEVKQFKAGNLSVKVFRNRTAMGEKAADECAECILKLLEKKETINMVFAAAPSQNDMLMFLSRKELPWDRINAFHMDEYVGLKKTDEQSFGKYLNDHIFGLVPFRSVNYISDYGEDYAGLLEKNHVDIVCLGIGENGHIAFNDPGEADFNDSKLVRKVALDDVCRMQQVHDGCFPAFDDVPEYALTLTIPEMVSADYMFCVVPASTKADAVYRTINEEISENCPATILRKHGNAVMYCDMNSAEKIL